MRARSASCEVLLNSSLCRLSSALRALMSFTMLSPWMTAGMLEVSIGPRPGDLWGAGGSTRLPDRDPATLEDEAAGEELGMPRSESERRGEITSDIDVGRLGLAVGEGILTGGTFVRS